MKSVNAETRALKASVKKIILIILAVFLATVSFGLFVSDYAKPVIKIYYLWSWTSRGESNVPTLEDNPLFTITIVKTGGKQIASMLMPVIYGEYDANGNKYPDGVAGSGVPDPNNPGWPLMTAIPLNILQDSRGRVSFVSFRQDEETGELVSVFQLNCYQYKNYLVPDLNNPHLRFSNNVRGLIFDSVFPKYFSLKDAPPSSWGNAVAELKKETGLYCVTMFDENKNAYVYADPSDPANNPYLYLNQGQVYDSAHYAGDKLIADGQPYASYDFQNNGILSITNYSVNQSARILNFKAYVPIIPGTELEFSVLTSTFFVYDGNI